MKIDEFWNMFLRESGKNKKLKYRDCFHFDLTEEWANKLLELVLIGRKQATASSLLQFELNDEEAPQIGDHSIITDWDGNPRCVIETTSIIILPFKDITFDICKREGEDDNLESWREAHRRFFTAEGKELGYTFSEDMPVVFEDFKVVFKR